MLTATNIDLETLIKTKLPPLPGSVIKISALLRDIHVSQRAIAEAIGYDPMLASRILRLINSPAYACEQTITSLNTAVGILGNKTIYEIVLMGAVVSSFGRDIKNSVIGRDIWFHSLATAFAARELGAALKIHGLDGAFSCGLLRDIGRLLIFRCDTELFAEISRRADSGEDLLEVEREMLGFDHAQIGALAVHRWQLSESVCNMILYHHNSSNAVQGVMMTNLVSVADQLCYLKNEKMEIDSSFLLSEPVIMLGLQAEQIERAWETVVVHLREVIKTFFR